MGRVQTHETLSYREELVVNRIKLLLALGATAAALAGAACNKARSNGPRTSSSGQALSTAMVLRVDLPPAVLPGDALSLEVSFRNSAGQLLDVADKVTVSLAVNPSGAVMTGTTTRAAVNGVARFNDLAIAKRGQGYQLLVSSLRAASVKSAPFAVTWSTDELEAAGTASNDTAAGAEAISPDVPMFGMLGPGDVDVYRFHASAGQLLSVATHATRLDLGNWDTSLRLRLIAADGTTEIARGGAFGKDTPSVDTGFAGIRIPDSGDYYLACDTDRRGFLSGKYALVVQLASLPAGLQVESEPPGATGKNDTLATAQALIPGVLHGYSDAAAPGALPSSDYFKIAIASPAHVRLDLWPRRATAPSRATIPGIHGSSCRTPPATCSPATMAPRSWTPRSTSSSPRRGPTTFAWRAPPTVPPPEARRTSSPTIPLRTRRWRRRRATPPPPRRCRLDTATRSRAPSTRPATTTSSSSAPPATRSGSGWRIGRSSREHRSPSTAPRARTRHS